jgi:hypothetical protein
MRVVAERERRQDGRPCINRHLGVYLRTIAIGAAEAEHLRRRTGGDARLSRHVTQGRSDMATPRSRVFRALTMLAAAALAAGCAQAPKDVTVANAIEATATVESVDYANRVVVLRDERGQPFVVIASEEVRNLDQVKAGDRVVTRYREAIAAELVKPGTGVAGIQPSVTTARAIPGERPFGAVARQVRTTVKIYDVDTVANVVEFTGPSGYNRRVKVMDPKAREFIRHLKPGDEVEVTMTEAAAISVEPAK